MQRDFREGAEEEIERRLGPESRDWSVGTLYGDVIAAMNADARLEGKGYPAGASALEAACINVVRGARFKAERIEAFNREQERKNKG